MSEVYSQQNHAQPLDINAFETALDEMLRCYGQALLAAEKLPARGRVPLAEYLVVITKSVPQKQSLILRLWMGMKQTRTDKADWVRSRIANRTIVKIYLHAHIRSKLQAVAEYLEAEKLTTEGIDMAKSARLDSIIRKLQDYDKAFAQRKATWLKLPGWIWTVIAPLVSAGVGAIVTLHSGITASEVLVNITLALLISTMFLWVPLFTLWSLDGFRWKRLILMGQIGDLNPDISATVVLRWLPSPPSNTYAFEDRLFKILGITKPKEVPWDFILLPTTTISAVMALACFLLGMVAIIPAKTLLDWSVLIALVFLAVSFFITLSILRSKLRVVKDRESRSAC